MRKLLAIAMGAALAFSLAASMGPDAEAAKRRAGGGKSCSAANMLTGQKASWKCKASEKCCYDAIMAKGTCAPAAGMCM